ncbi:MAG: methyltransferase domain-containing protein [Planctomycetota bacterium]|jgi:SAM-dependent methyltransferase|nr:methyltransferase domain-containing protein [Planctomycetota bacterium]
MRVDFGITAKDNARYRLGFPDSFFERLSLFGIGREGQRVLDLGTGAGSMARGLARRRCEVVGLDSSAEYVAEARRLDKKADVSISYVRAAAEDTGLEDDGFDVIAAGQSWHWFDSAQVIPECIRLLIPGGSLVIAYFDWLALPGSVVEATEQILREYEPEFDPAGGSGLHPQWLKDLAVAGFQNIETFSYGIRASYKHEAWRGRIRACPAVGGSLSPDKLAACDAELKAMMERRFPEDPLSIQHRIFAVIAKGP